MRERDAIEILEESIQLLRAAPSKAIAAYLAGAVPFFLRQDDAQSVGAVRLMKE